MNEIYNTLFSDYLSEQKVASQPEYSALAKQALHTEQDLRNQLNAEQTELFEKLLEISSQIHYLEVKDAFFNACSTSAKATKDLI